jgi:hypothetical protein
MMESVPRRAVPLHPRRFLPLVLTNLASAASEPVERRTSAAATRSAATSHLQLLEIDEACRGLSQDLRGPIEFSPPGNA